MASFPKAPNDTVALIRRATTYNVQLLYCVTFSATIMQPPFWSAVLLIVLSQVWLLVNWGSLATSRSNTSNNDKIRKKINTNI